MEMLNGVDRNSVDIEMVILKTQNPPSEGSYPDEDWNEEMTRRWNRVSELLLEHAEKHAQSNPRLSELLKTVAHRKRPRARDVRILRFALDQNRGV